MKLCAHAELDEGVVYVQLFHSMKPCCSKHERDGVARTACEYRVNHKCTDVSTPYCDGIQMKFGRCTLGIEESMRA